MTAFAATGVVALIVNVVLGEGLDVAEWSTQNIAVVPMLAVTLVAMFVRSRWVQVAAPLALMAIWLFYFVDLQDALK
ncbi:MAG TPA: hypothetical protein VG387_08975 [Rhizomicrobium sp.]|jgi:hypothetical protein|nr:hypothetical protein [Rhizomicrobium sp.]